jgi:hypothetical protein
MKYEAEKEWIAAQNEYFDYIESYVLDNLYSGECMDQLHKGYDIVCRVDTEAMMALDYVLATCITGAAIILAKQFHDNSGDAYVIIPCDNNRVVEWFVKG